MQAALAVARERRRDRGRVRSTASRLPLFLLGLQVAGCSLVPTTAAPKATPSETPAPTHTSLPTTTASPFPTKTPTEATNPLVDLGCVHWSAVTHEDVGMDLCVFGRVVQVSECPSGDPIFDPTCPRAWYAYFSEDTSSGSKDFRLYAINVWYFGISAGDCISLEGIVRSNGDKSFVFINPASVSTGGEVHSYRDTSICND